jgi:hypothetical protein
MITNEEKSTLLELANKYRGYETQLIEIEKAQEVLREKFVAITDEISVTKEKEIEILTALEEKYQRVFTANDLLEILNS